MICVEEMKNYQSQVEEGKLQCLGLGDEEEDALEELLATQVTQLGGDLVRGKAWLVQLRWSRTVVACRLEVEAVAAWVVLVPVIPQLLGLLHNVLGP